MAAADAHGWLGEQADLLWLCEVVDHNEPAAWSNHIGPGSAADYPAYHPRRQPGHVPPDHPNCLSKQPQQS